MDVRYDNAFHRSIKKITDQTVKENIAQAISSVKAAQTPQNIPGLKKMKKDKISYRIKIGNYRIGVEILGNTVAFVAFSHRKDIYKFFPH